MGICAARLQAGAFRADSDRQRRAHLRCGGSGAEGTGSAAQAKKDACKFHVRVLPSSKSAAPAYDVELCGPNNLEIRTTRTLHDFGRTWSLLRQAFPAAVASRSALSLPMLLKGAHTDDDGMGGPDVWPAAAMAPSRVALDSACGAWASPRSESAELQRWLNEVCRDELIFSCSRPLQDLLGVHGLLGHQAPHGTSSGLATIIDCHEPVLIEIVGFVAGMPRDFVRFAAASRGVARQIGFMVRDVWRDLYARRWPAFADFLRFQGCEEWQLAYKETLCGRREAMLEVFDREKKLGFAMAAMAARVEYDLVTDCYVARYLSASEVQPEYIPSEEFYRLRFCPPSALDALWPAVRRAGDVQPEASPCSSLGSRRAPRASYPYRVLEGVGDLQVGQGVELQWKMQFGSPFGWWFGHLEDLQRDQGSHTALATITFKHFPATSRWYRLLVRFGDAEQRPCAFGGYTGGIRGVTPEERTLWMRFFPEDPVVL